MVSDVKTFSEDSRIDPQVYEAFAQRPVPSMSLMLRTTVEPNSLIPRLRASVAALDPELPLLRTMDMDGVIDEQKTGNTLFTRLLAAFALLALTLACVGIYGLISYSVGQRTHEIGIRVALGADTSDISRMVVKQGFKIAALGSAAGLSLALPLPNLFNSIFLGILFSVARRVSGRIHRGLGCGHACDRWTGAAGGTRQPRHRLAQRMIAAFPFRTATICNDPNLGVPQHENIPPALHPRAGVMTISPSPSRNTWRRRSKSWSKAACRARQARTGRSARVRQRAARPAAQPRRVAVARARIHPGRPEIHPSPAAQIARLCAHRAAHPGHRHRRQHRRIQRHQQRSHQAPPLSGLGPPGGAVAAGPGRGRPVQLRKRPALVALHVLHLRRAQPHI